MNAIKHLQPFPALCALPADIDDIQFNVAVHAIVHLKLGLNDTYGLISNTHIIIKCDLIIGRSKLHHSIQKIWRIIHHMRFFAHFKHGFQSVGVPQCCYIFGKRHTQMRLSHQIKVLRHTGGKSLELRRRIRKFGNILNAILHENEILFAQITDIHHNVFVHVLNGVRWNARFVFLFIVDVVTTTTAVIRSMHLLQYGAFATAACAE
mmetsp:Transcript_58017/g.96207  ORF Transcript_58017/g.96207 Transcript_58017/m.96207 type:complete len:207 (-) Transcript_58017:283-903(-)